MLLWAALIVTLIISLIIGLIGRYPQEFIVGTAYLILLVSLGVFYRVLRRIRGGRIELLTREIEMLRRENEIMRSKLGIRPITAMDKEKYKISTLEEHKEEM